MAFPNTEQIWKPGQSGNPAGKPKGSKHLTTWIQELLEDDEFESEIEQGSKVVQFKGAPIRAIVMAAQQKALNGDVKAMDLLMKYGWAAKSEVDVTTKGESINGAVDPAAAAAYAEYLKGK